MILHGDCREVLATLDAESVDATVTDPPYGLRFMGKRWDYDVPPVEVWRECFRVLKDGGRLLAFAGTRTMHRMWCNIEDAGFTIEDSIAWMYGSGFPKHKSKLKPAYEPVCVARKGAVSPLNIDACRISTNETLTGSSVRCDIRGGNFGNGHRPNPGDIADYQQHVAGRWPANVLLDEAAAEALDEQSGERRSPCGTNKVGEGGQFGTDKYGSANGRSTESRRGLGDSGGASRFFYVTKASKRERGEGNDHPTVKPVDLMRYLIRLVTPPGGVVLDPFAGSGTTAVAAQEEGLRWIVVEQEERYVEIIRKRTSQGALWLDGAA